MRDISGDPQSIANKLRYATSKTSTSYNAAWELGVKYAQFGSKFSKDKIIEIAKTARTGDRYDKKAYMLGLVEGYIFEADRIGLIPKEDITMSDLRRMGVTLSDLNKSYKSSKR